jgi:hypothetical protein
MYPYMDECFNGFFIRDDVPENFTDYWGQNGFPDFIEVPNINSDYTQGGGIGNEESQDQVWGLLVGLSLVKKLVDFPETFNDGDNQYVTIRQWAQKITYRMIKFMHSVRNDTQWIKCFLGEECWPGYWEATQWSIAQWLVKNPNTLDIVARGGSFEDLLPFGYLFAEAGNYITDLIPSDLHYNALEPLYIGPIPLTSNMFWNEHGRLALATIAGIVWAESFDDLIHWIHRCSKVFNAPLEDNINDKKAYAFEHFPLMYLVLHENYPNNYFLDYYLSFIENLLNIASYDGPENYGDFSIVEWCNPSRLNKPVGLTFQQNNPEIYGEYNGIDYLLLYNLFWLVYHTYFNTNRIISETIPIEYQMNGGDTIMQLGYKDNPVMFHISSLSTITANNLIESNSKVVYRAGDYIKFNSGFKVENGAYFRAEIDPNKNLEYENGNLKSSNILDNALSNKNVDIIDNKLENLKLLSNLNISLFPIPANNKLNINFSYSNNLDSDIVILKVIIYNFSGQIVYQNEQIESNPFEIDVSNCPNGLYLIKFISAEFQIERKIIISH